MGARYQHKGRSATEPRRNTSPAVPAVEVEYTTCPHCSAVQSVSNLIAYGCRRCKQLPNAAGRRS